ncbi:hypothetical protein ACL7TT_15125 [Microbulbifer sp. 2304DJ12-6]|uniref:hypothetical protein n=1 Tax=Microbulbifer sp. 2304DJ12-6 TaxID=3233340 RepID=UPI0039B037BE
MAKKQFVSLKKVAKWSMASTLLLGIFIVISSLINQIAIMQSFALAYMAVSLVFSVSTFMLILRHYKITSGNDILVRFIAIIGAVFCCCIWLVLFYPVAMLLS